MEWTKCSYELPGVGQYVLTYEKKYINSPYTPFDVSFFNLEFFNLLGDVIEPDYWMPLPDHPIMENITVDYDHLFDKDE